jgi:hypothetical protein
LKTIEERHKRLIDEMAGNPHRKLSVDDIAAKAAGLGLARRDDAVRLIREDRDR